MIISLPSLAHLALSKKKTRHRRVFFVQHALKSGCGGRI